MPLFLVFIGLLSPTSILKPFGPHTLPVVHLESEQSRATKRDAF